MRAEGWEKKVMGCGRRPNILAGHPCCTLLTASGLRRLSITRHLSAASGYKGSLQRTSDSDMSVVGSWYLESLTNLITNHPDKKKVPAVSV